MDFNFRWTSNIKITRRDLGGHILDIVEFHNLLMDAALDMFGGGLFGDVTDLEITTLAVGDDDGSILPLAVTNVALGNELDTYGTTSHSKPATGEHLHVNYLSPTDSVYQIEELGWLCQAGGVILISIAFYDHDHTGLESLQIERVDKIERKP